MNQEASRRFNRLARIAQIRNALAIAGGVVLTIGFVFLLPKTPVTVEGTGYGYFKADPKAGFQLLSMLPQPEFLNLIGGVLMASGVVLLLAAAVLWRYEWSEDDDSGA